jgi:23S rRNA (cytidine1920-2'-O)/16S rRNA (cytidine1409-2'-O)-methyltransferase
VTRPTTRVRADQLLLERKLATSRSQAQALLLAGRVYSLEQRIDKAGTLLVADCALSVRGQPRFVSRGGDKLEAALEQLEFDVANLVAADIGASTGGFTDCLLQRGTRRVYAIDVGHGQLAHKLRQDERVVVMEGTNARHLTADSLDEPLDLVVVDASFISLRKLLSAISALLREEGHLVGLIKPQFEVGKTIASKSRGVVRDPATRQQAIDEVLASVVAAGFEVLADCPSAVAGPKGNVEHFVLARRARVALGQAQPDP